MSLASRGADMKGAEDADARIEVELKRGLLQLAVLSMARERTYGYRLCKALAACGLDVEEGTLYPILRRMESRGLLESLWETTGSRPRKYYVITESGRSTLTGLTASWNRIREALDGVLEQES